MLLAPLPKQRKRKKVSRATAEVVGSGFMDLYNEKKKGGA